VLVSRNHESLIFLIIAAVGALLVMAALDFTRSLILDLLGGRRAWMRVNWVFRHEIPNK
jgi:ABC-type protease/lipase transport system fused ATPase/permease subunit